MNIERTLAIIKPHAVKEHNTGLIIHLIELNKFKIVNLVKKHLTKSETEKFYEIHKERPFFNDLVSNISAGPVILLELEKDNAIQAWRDLMGATDPLKASVGTLRIMFGESIDFNAVHGSDSVENAKKEISMFFK